MSHILLCLCVGVLSVSAQSIRDVQGVKGCVLSKQRMEGLYRTSRSKGVGKNYDLKYHRFNWLIDPDTFYIKGCVTSYVVPAENLSELRFELSSALTIDSVIYRLNRVLFDHQDDLLTIHVGQLLQAGVVDSVAVFYQGIPSDGKVSGAFSRGWHGYPDSTAVLSTLSEPYGARDWWPCKNDLSDKVDSIDTYIEVPANLVAASNGVLKEVQSTAFGTIYHWQHRYPIAAYLIGLSVTNYKLMKDSLPVGDGHLLIHNFLYPEYDPFQSNHYDLFRQAIVLFDSLFVPYPFMKEQYGHAQWNYQGGMEHQTMSFISKFEYGLLIHELAHQWFGNMITCASWADIWLNEGFATYLTGLSYEHLQDGFYWEIWKKNVREDILEKPDGSVFVYDIFSSDRLFDARLSYLKGAYLLHMLRWVMGDQVFYEGMNNYLTDGGLVYSYASSKHFIAHMEQVHGGRLDWFFDDWLYGEGHPIYTVQVHHIENYIYQVVIGQLSSHPSVGFFEMPVELRLFGGGQDSSFIFNHEFPGQVFTLNTGFEVDSIQFDPDRWLVAEYVIQLTTATATTATEVSVFPTLVEDRLTITFPLGNESVHARVLSLSGRLLGEFMIAAGRQQVDLSSLPAGLYFIELRLPEKGYTQKFIKY